MKKEQDRRRAVDRHADRCAGITEIKPAVEFLASSTVAILTPLLPTLLINIRRKTRILSIERNTVEGAVDSRLAG